LAPSLILPAASNPGDHDDHRVKLLFLVGDAPPHLDYPDDPHYTDDMHGAARDGIKIETLAASGLDDQGEYIWRQIAEATLGQFIFLTYGPNDTTPHHVTGYTPDNLDDLVVRLITTELAPASNTQQTSTTSAANQTTTTNPAPTTTNPPQPTSTTVPSTTVPPATTTSSPQPSP
jgi:hypothetical protein